MEFEFHRAKYSKLGQEDLLSKGSSRKLQSSLHNVVSSKEQNGFLFAKQTLKQLVPEMHCTKSVVAAKVCIFFCMTAS